MNLFWCWKLCTAPSLTDPPSRVLPLAEGSRAQFPAPEQVHGPRGYGLEQGSTGRQLQGAGGPEDPAASDVSAADADARDVAPDARQPTDAGCPQPAGPQCEREHKREEARQTLLRSRSPLCLGEALLAQKEAHLRQLSNLGSQELAREGARE